MSNAMWGRIKNTKAVKKLWSIDSLDSAEALWNIPLFVTEVAKVLEMSPPNFSFIVKKRLGNLNIDDYDWIDLDQIRKDVKNMPSVVKFDDVTAYVDGLIKKYITLHKRTTEQALVQTLTAEDVLSWLTAA
jgi:hypothetical protein